MKKIGVIGFGARAEGMLKNLNTFELDTAVTAVIDRDRDGAISRIRSAGFDETNVRFYDTVDEMLAAQSLDGVVIATNCNTHTDFAIDVMRHNVPMLLEKPVCIDNEQLSRLIEAEKNYKAPSLVCFPLRGSYLCQLVKQIVDRGDIGEVQHVEAVNNVSYGRVYYKGWYRNDTITGGLFLQKATHDLDYINYLLGGRKPIMVCAMESKQVFKGNEPAGKVCDLCDKNGVCPESEKVIRHMYQESCSNRGCSFAVDTGNHDSASVIVRYDSGMHAVYTQNFYARKKAARRGARLIGYEGTLEFDWVTGDCTVYSHTSLQTASYHIDDNAAFHYGGDKMLCYNFVDIMEGKPSLAPLQDGIRSAHMCLQARESALTDRFMPVTY